MPDIHVIPGIWSVSIGYEAMIRWFRETFDVVEEDASHPDRIANFVQFPYDWRLSNRASAVALQAQGRAAARTLPDATGPMPTRRSCSSDTRWAGSSPATTWTCSAGTRSRSKVITLGTPHRGALNALESLVNGVSKGFGPVQARSDEALAEPAVAVSAAARVRVSRVRQRTAQDDRGRHCPTSTPALDRRRDAVPRGTAQRRRRGSPLGYDSHPIIARTQPTRTTARLRDDRVETVRTHRGPRRRRRRHGAAAVGDLRTGSRPTTPSCATSRTSTARSPPTPRCSSSSRVCSRRSDVIARDTSYDVGVVVRRHLDRRRDRRRDHRSRVGPRRRRRAVQPGRNGRVEQRSRSIGATTRTRRASTMSHRARTLVRVGVRGAGGVVTNPLVVLPPIDPEDSVMSEPRAHGHGADRRRRPARRTLAARSTSTTVGSRRCNRSRRRHRRAIGVAAGSARAGSSRPGLIDLHNHLAYNTLPLWIGRDRAVRHPLPVARRADLPERRVEPGPGARHRRAGRRAALRRGQGGRRRGHRDPGIAADDPRLPRMDGAQRREGGDRHQEADLPVGPAGDRGAARHDGRTTRATAARSSTTWRGRRPEAAYGVHAPARRTTASATG